MVDAQSNNHEEDIVERLRELANDQHQDGETIDAPLVDEAAEEIERLRLRISRAQGLVERYKDDPEKWVAVFAIDLRRALRE